MSIPELLLGAPPHIALMASLPSLPDIFAAKRTPISRLRLEQRLRALTPADKALLDTLEELLAWHGRDPGLTDADFVQRTRALVPRLPSTALKRAVEHALELRSIVAALRRRQRGEPVPPADVTWSYGRWTATMALGWQDPGLGLERAFPWVREAAELVKTGDAIALESLLMRERWTMLGRLRVGHDFDFTAVALYVLRYQLVERRVAYDVDAATMRFRRLVADGLAGFTDERAAA